MSMTLEAELEQLITDADYLVAVIHASDRYINLRIVYLPRFEMGGVEGCRYVKSGLIAEQHFMQRSPRRRWRKARAWAQREIAGHREFIRGIPA